MHVERGRRLRKPVTPSLPCGARVCELMLHAMQVDALHALATALLIIRTTSTRPRVIRTELLLLALLMATRH